MRFATAVRSTLFAAAALSAGTASAATQILGFNPYGARLTDNAIFQVNNGSGPIILQSATDQKATMSFAFTVPRDYKGDGALKVVFLWEGFNDSNCNVLFAPAFLYRARNGLPYDGGSPSAGLVGLSASTTFTKIGTSIAVAAPATAGTDQRVTFEIRGTAGEFKAPLKAGDAIAFGISRNDIAADTCVNNIAISGVSLQYSDAPAP